MTPLERAIKAKTDKRVRYRVRREQEGFQRVEVLVPSEDADKVRAFAASLREAKERTCD